MTILVLHEGRLFVLLGLQHCQLRVRSEGHDHGMTIVNKSLVVLDLFHYGFLNTVLLFESHEPENWIRINIRDIGIVIITNDVIHSVQ